MKRLIYYFSVCLIMGLVSCSSDDDEGGISYKTIAGHWQSVSYHGTYTDYRTGEEEVNGEHEYTGLVFKLYDDGTCYYHNHSGTYKLLGKELDLEVHYVTDGLDREGNTVKRNVDIHDTFTIDEFKTNTMIITTDWLFVNGKSHNTYTMKKVN